MALHGLCLCSHSKLQAEHAFGSRDRSGPNFSPSLKYLDYLGWVKEHCCQKLALRQEARYVLLHGLEVEIVFSFGSAQESLQ